MKTIKVQNLTSSNGNEVLNQFKIRTEEGVYFRSYSSIIVFVPNEGKTQLDMNKWDYSKTTGKYRNQFLGETKSETQRKIDKGVYELVDLSF